MKIPRLFLVLVVLFSTALHVEAFAVNEESGTSFWTTPIAYANAAFAGIAAFFRPIWQGRPTGDQANGQQQLRAGGRPASVPRLEIPQATIVATGLSGGAVSPGVLPAQTRLRILFIDDEPGQLMSPRRHVGQLGHEIEVAYTGEEGARLALEQDFDVIFLDHHMPGLNGLETLELLNGCGAIIVSHSTAMTAELRAQYEARGVKFFVDKSKPHREVYAELFRQITQ